ncbi:MAG: proprotein convertase P-domain-containing protein [Planctomycetota bacterium]
MRNLIFALLLVSLGSTWGFTQPQVSECSTTTPQPTLGGGMLTDSIIVNENWTITDVAVDVDVTHPFIGQLVVELRSPSNTVVRLHDEGGFNADNIQLTFTDGGVANATQNYNCGCDMQPSGLGGQGSLADFVGEGAAGTWSLEIFDFEPLNNGMLNSWCVNVWSNDPTFLRGDTNSDGEIHLNDAVLLLGYLFVPGSVVPFCLDAADVDDGGSNDLNDAIYLLQYMFVPGSPAPPAPFQQCSIDPTTDPLLTCFPAPGC